MSLLLPSPTAPIPARSPPPCGPTVRGLSPEALPGSAADALPVSTAQPEWLRVISDREADIGSDLHWACAAAGKPRPAVRWLRNGEPLTSQVGDLGRPSSPTQRTALCFLVPSPPGLPLHTHTPGDPLGR